MAKKIKVGLILHPCPVIVDEYGQAFSPVRTNQFPISQMTIANSLDPEKVESILIDLRSIAYPQQWRNFLFKEYAHPITYGSTILYRYLISDFKSRLQKYTDEIDLYVLTANFTFESNAVAQTIVELKRHNIRAIIAVGGRDASARPNFYRSAGADYIGIGDGDESLPKFIDNLIANNLNNYLSGIIPELPVSESKCMPTKINVFNSQYVKHVESGGGLLFKTLAQKGSYAYMQTTRGCPHGCAFCTEKKSLLSAPLSMVIETIDRYKDDRVGIIGFIDANLLVLRKEKEICRIFEHMRKAQLAWEFPSGIEVKKLFNSQGEPKKEMIDSLFWNNGNPEDFSGLIRLLVPFEDSLLKETSLNKLSRIDHNQVLNELYSRNVPYANLAIMVGAPDESPENRMKLERHLDLIFNDTFSVSTRLNFSIFCIMPLPGTAQYAPLLHEKRITYDIDLYPELWNVFCSVIQGDNFTPEDTTTFREMLLSKYGMEQNSGKIALPMKNAKMMQALIGADQ